jgi:hypothetical protein
MVRPADFNTSSKLCWLTACATGAGVGADTGAGLGAGLGVGVVVSTVIEIVLDAMLGLPAPSVKVLAKTLKVAGVVLLLVGVKVAV